jgi:diacylglycerol O-acyltransferase / wax synthase
MAERLTALDATFLELEDLDDGAVMSIGRTMVFDPLPAGAPTLDELRARLSTRLAALPRYTQRLSSPHVPAWSWPQWIEDEHFDVANHVAHVALPAPGDDGQLCDWAAEFFSHPLDRSRPLWELALIEGLAHGRWALGLKVHHCLIDGIGSVAITDALLDTEPDPESTAVSDEGTVPDGTPTWLNPAEAMVHATGAGLRAASAGVRAALHPTEAFERSVAVAGLVREEISGAPRTSLNVPIGPSRRYAIVRVPLSELRAIRDALGGSVNDVILSACAGGLRRLLDSRGETLPKRGLRAMVPMNVRDITEAEPIGNKVTSLFVDLPIREADPAKRLRTIATSTRRLKAAGSPATAEALIDVAALAPPVVVHAALARTAFARRLFNVTITNVPGHQEPLYAFGAQLREVLPVVPLAAEHAVGIAIFSYNGAVIFGVCVDSGTTPDLDVLAYGIEAELEGLRSCVLTLKNPAHEMRI